MVFKLFSNFNTLFYFVIRFLIDDTFLRTEACNTLKGLLRNNNKTVEHIIKFSYKMQLKKAYPNLNLNI